MMTLAAGALTALVGPLFRWLTLPMLLLGGLTASHLAWQNHKEKLRLQAEKVCDARWEQRIRNEERSRAEREISGVRSLIETERQTAQELRDDNEKLTGELQDLLSNSSGDESCLSSGVLDKLRGRPRS